MPKLVNVQQIRHDALLELASLFMNDPEWHAILVNIKQLCSRGFSGLASEIDKLYLAKGREISAKYLDPWINGNFEIQFKPYIELFARNIQNQKIGISNFAVELAIIMLNLELQSAFRAKGLAIKKLKYYYPEQVVYREGEEAPSVPGFPWITVDPLKLTIMPWSAMYLDKAQVLRQVRKELALYEKYLRAKDYKERPSELRKHARWWFKYNIKKKQYSRIATEEAEMGEKVVEESAIAYGVKTFESYFVSAPV